MSVPKRMAAIAATLAAAPGRIAAEAGSREVFRAVMQDLVDYGHTATLRYVANSPALTDDERDVLRDVLWGNRPTTPALLH